MSNDIAYLFLFKRKKELENELEAIKIAMSCIEKAVENGEKNEKIDNNFQ